MDKERWKFSFVDPVTKLQRRVYITLPRERAVETFNGTFPDVGFTIEKAKPDASR